MESFKNLVPQYAVVRRNGEKITVKAAELTLGDIVEIKFGDRVPADLRVIEARGFKVKRNTVKLLSDPSPIIGNACHRGSNRQFFPQKF